MEPMCPELQCSLLEGTPLLAEAQDVADPVEEEAEADHVDAAVAAEAVALSHVSIAVGNML